MSTVLLRKLTLKSKFKFGKYHDLTVQSLINLKGYKGLDYITKIYYTCSNISFMEDILEMCGITSENLIDKPGKELDRDKSWNYVQIAMKNRMAVEDRENAMNQRKSNVKLGKVVGKINANSRRNRNIYQSRKSILQSKNQGKS